MAYSRKQELVDLLFEVEDSFDTLKNVKLKYEDLFDEKKDEMYKFKYFYRLVSNDLLFYMRALRDFAEDVDGQRT